MTQSARRFDIPCTIEVEHTNEHLHAHVSLEGDVPIYPGDRVRVHGEAIQVLFGESATYSRTATVMRAGWLSRQWTKFLASLEITELYEVSFSAGRKL
ncbi:MAG: hypothetical protein NXI12_09925 [Alphaproteobacteria bacterium]|nr:hypothetical protein [Alphaproteobacteria bacterium]